MPKINDSKIDFEGKLLLATPEMSDFRFEKSVILVCSHNTSGSMGIIVNKPTLDLKFNDILDQLKIKSKVTKTFHRIFFGGPVEYGRGFVIHSDDYDAPDASVRIKEDYCLTASIEILQDMANDRGPKDCILALGYAGWGPGQLEKEISLDSWLVCDADSELVFSVHPETKWNKALKKIGISPAQLATLGGSA